MSEQAIQNRIMTYLKKLGAYSLKVISAGKNGVPDIIVSLDGRFVGIEVKRPGEQPTALQSYNIEQIRKSGGVAFVADSIQSVKEQLKEQGVL